MRVIGGNPRRRARSMTELRPTWSCEATACQGMPAARKWSNWASAWDDHMMAVDILWVLEDMRQACRRQAGGHEELLE
jgi:hypothetical protein